MLRTSPRLGYSNKLTSFLLGGVLLHSFCKSPLFFSKSLNLGFDFNGIKRIFRFFLGFLREGKMKCKFLLTSRKSAVEIFFLDVMILIINLSLT